MNIIAIQLVLVGTKSGLVVMCKILTVVVAFYLRMHARLFYFPWLQLTTARLDTVSVVIFVV